MRTYVAKGAEAEALKVGAQWFVIDATNQVLGRLATKAARLLIGKDKAAFTPYLDSGDHVVVINADKIKMTGNKVEQKVYHSHSGYPGGLKEVPAKRVRESKPEWVVREAIVGMLPKNKLRARRARKLRVYRDAAGLARHAGQKPQSLGLLVLATSSRGWANNFASKGSFLSSVLAGSNPPVECTRSRGAVSSLPAQAGQAGFEEEHLSTGETPAVGTKTWFHGTGRRKESIARVFVRAGTGKF